MTEQTAPSTLTKSVVVDVPREHAFEVFTKRFDAWWPREHHLREADMADPRPLRRQGRGAAPHLRVIRRLDRTAGALRPRSGLLGAQPGRWCQGGAASASRSAAPPSRSTAGP